MFEKLKQLFRSDEFVPSSAVFPEIDKNALAQELKLEEEGRARGSSEQPEQTASSLDHIEYDAVGKVEELRRRGLENFETNRRVYAERLNLAVTARMQVSTESNAAKSEFNAELTTWNAKMVSPRQRIQLAYKWFEEFRLRNKLTRPAKPASRWVIIIGLALIMIIIESVANAYLFSQSNPLGLLGGVIAAFLVSVGNVVVCALLGTGARFINARLIFPIKKLFGLLCWGVFVGFTCTYNLAVAHFRDAAETQGEWREAGELALETLKTNAIGLSTMESYVLLVIGACISVASFIKGYYSRDAYPGYSKVAQDVLDARNAYVFELEESIETLKERRDEAVDALEDANDEVHRQINDSVDALYGHSALASGVAPFLEQCDIAANYLLAVYRDANRASRTDPAPSYFGERYQFSSFTAPEIDDERRRTAEAEVKEVAELVDAAIKEIFLIFDDNLDQHYEIDELEGTNIERKSKRKRPSATIKTLAEDT